MFNDLCKLVLDIPLDFKFGKWKIDSSENYGNPRLLFDYDDENYIGQIIVHEWGPCVILQVMNVKTEEYVLNISYDVCVPGIPSTGQIEKFSALLQEFKNIILTK